MHNFLTVILRMHVLCQQRQLGLEVLWPCFELCTQELGGDSYKKKILICWPFNTNINIVEHTQVVGDCCHNTPCMFGAQLVY